MSALPSVGAVLSDRTPVELDAILTSINEYMQARPKAQDLAMLHVFKNEQLSGGSQDVGFQLATSLTCG